ncbi:PEP-CTERM sorting domain-containing protein [Sphingomonas sp. QA11]|nr:DUF4886 domain-containing protein [Sphingomonas sp. QA11]WCM29913.1 PEP-CTERM sorting domain-containing protein [Sphingomonas sp. QA11]
MGKIGFLVAASLAALAPVAAVARAQVQAPPVARAAAKTILFVGNSFTQGAHSAVRRYRTDTVTDLTGDGTGGVPAIFKLMAQQAGLSYEVSLETQGGKGLDFHYETRRALLDRKWDVVVLQDFSTLDRARPGDPGLLLRYSGLFATMFRQRNPAVRIELNSTWSRADETYLPKGHWYGKPITAMALDLRAGANLALANRSVDGIIAVGEAWNRAFAEKVADPNPYDGIDFGKLDLWTYDQYHGSVAGYYLEALMIFGKVTGRDPRMLGAKERAADDLGLSEGQAVALQNVAFRQIEAEKTPR